MRILFFSPTVFWPANSGARIRDYYLLRSLARVASVSFLGICLPGEETSAAQVRHQIPLQEFRLVPKAGRYTTWNLFRGFTGPTPITILNYLDGQVLFCLRQLLQQNSFDVVQMEGVHLAGYLPVVRSAAPRTLVICDWHDVESDRMSRYCSHAPNRLQSVYARRTASLLRCAERKLLEGCDAHVAVSDRDLALLRANVPHINAAVIENGVDVPYYCSGQECPPAEQSRSKVVFVGSMDFHPNIDAATYFAHEIWPKLRVQAPGLEFVIVGSNPLTEVWELAKLPGVKVTGTVDDVRPYYDSALAAVVPMRIAGGTRLKILEAMAAGVPVVSTRIGAEGLAFTPDVDFLLADTPDEMAAAVARLQRSPDLRCRILRQARARVTARYDWAALGESLYHLHSTWLARHHA